VTQLKEDSFNEFTLALEAYESLLHAETQAIAAKHLDTIEDILSKKDNSLNLLVSAKEHLQSDYQVDVEINSQVERVLQLQQRNTKAFNKFFNERSRKEKGLKEKLSTSDLRLKRTYQYPSL
jgi:uncharacterized protein YggE